MPEQRLPGVRVRTNEYLSDPDVKVSHNEWYAVSWEMDFGKQIDEHEATRSAENNQQIITQEVANTDDDTMTQQLSDNPNDDTHDVASTSPDFSNLTTDVGDNPYIRPPPTTESPPIPRNHRLQLSVLVRGKQQITIYDLTLNLTLILTSEDLTLSL